MATDKKSQREYSGTFRLRPGPDLHRHLAEQAAQQGMSLHQWTIELLSGASAFKADLDKLPEK